MIFRFSPADTRQAIRDFNNIRHNQVWHQLPRHRRRAAVRAGWHALERLPGESWPEFWQAEQLAH